MRFESARLERLRKSCSAGRKFTLAAQSREAKLTSYRSAEALRHPKAAIRWSFAATSSCQRRPSKRAGPRMCTPRL
jgi:hypothetical protein